MCTELGLKKSSLLEEAASDSTPSTRETEAHCRLAGSSAEWYHEECMRARECGDYAAQPRSQISLCKAAFPPVECGHWTGQPLGLAKLDKTLLQYLRKPTQATGSSRQGEQWGCGASPCEDGCGQAGVQAGVLAA